MKPYDNNYINRKIHEYSHYISEGRKGNFEIKKKVNNNMYIDGYMYRKAEGTNRNVVELHGPYNILMKISPLEVESSYMFIKHAKGKVGIVGLGLGFLAQELAKKQSVTEVIVYEIEKDVIDLYYSNFEENNKIKIINKNAFEAESDCFDYFFVDIYEYKLQERVVDDYIALNKLHKIKEYLFWGLEHFLLSCSYNEIVWVYIPELWMEISKEIFASMQEANLLDSYRKLDESLVSSILAKFKIVFND